MKTLIFSHGADIDGMGSVILAKLVFDDVDYVFANNTYDLGPMIMDYMERGELYKYNQIFVTDLAIPSPALEEVANNSIIRSRIKVFDHHKTSIEEGYGKYDFTHIVEEDKIGKRCGTDLFYEYLISERLIEPLTQITEFVELTRLLDTWEWKNAGAKGRLAADLSILFNTIGKNNYINIMCEKLTKDTTFKLTDEEKAIVKMKKLQYDEIIKKLYEKKSYFNDEFGNKYIALFSNHEYVGDLSEYIKSQNVDAKYLVTIDLEKGEYGQKSYRSIDDTFDVSEIAKIHGGGGHMNASGVNITCEQREYASALSNKDALKYLIDSSFTPSKKL